MTRTTARPGTVTSAPSKGRATCRWTRRLAAAVGLVALCALPTTTAGAIPSQDGRTSAQALLYVSDHGDNRVVALPTRGGDRTPVPFEGLVRPTGMVGDASGRLYVSDTGDNRVVVRAAESAGVVGACGAVAVDNGACPDPGRGARHDLGRNPRTWRPGTARTPGP
ncbi:hypothetical protein [Streptomyces sp. PanSC19]|uniref:hypothetical protein n=1 Tax=Streptomyces sp. PanSC19 TaxID=1520455 RepID=UPI001615DEC3|nr:hypothetical protein [Streptomyces sp. PanSC19]